MGRTRTRLQGTVRVETPYHDGAMAQAPEHHHYEHGDGHRRGLLGWLRGVATPHSHDAAQRVDEALESSREGIRTVKVSLAVLALTSALQAVVVAMSGSVALLGDTFHNVADALTSLPLWIAFTLGRRRPSRRYTYGYGRVEDLAGVFVVLMITFSSLLAGYEAIHRLRHPQDLKYLGAVMAAGVVGLVGNELVAVYRIRIGRRIGSGALVADGLHARTDGLTSLAVVVGAAGVAAGWRWADPAVGLLISAAIVLVLIRAARDVGRRLLDAVDTQLVDQAERVVLGVPGVHGLADLRIRWLGHRLVAEVSITVDRELSVVEAHEIAERTRHTLMHEVAKVSEVTVHADPCTHDGSDPHATSSHHFAQG